MEYGIKGRNPDSTNLAAGELYGRCRKPALQQESEWSLFCSRVERKVAQAHVYLDMDNVPLFLNSCPPPPKGCP